MREYRHQTCDRGASVNFQAGAVEPALPGHRRSGPLGAGACGSKPAWAGLDRRQKRSLWRAAACKVQGATRSAQPWRSWIFQAGAVEPASPGHRRSGPLGGQGATRSEQPWGQSHRGISTLIRRGPCGGCGKPLSAESSSAGNTARVSLQTPSCSARLSNAMWLVCRSRICNVSSRLK